MTVIQGRNHMYVTVPSHIARKVASIKIAKFTDSYVI